MAQGIIKKPVGDRGFGFNLPTEAKWSLQLPALHVSRGARAVGAAALLFVTSLLAGSPGVLADPAGTPVPGNLVVNGSFENVPGEGGLLFFSGIPGWQEVTGCRIEVWSHGFIRFADDGHRLLELDAFCNGAVQQTVPTTPGQTYKLSYSFAARPGTALASNRLRVFVNGGLAGDHPAIAADYTTWRKLSTNITATGTSTTLKFAGAGTSDGLGSLLDHVSLVLVNVDTTPPVITPIVSGTLGNNGWYTSNVTVSWDVTDPQSAITSTSGCGTSTVVTDTAGTTFACTATSAGGTASVSVTIQRDTTAPTVACSVTPNAIWPPNHKLVNANASVSVTDPLSGSAGFTLVSATSNEPDDGLGDGDTPNDIQGFVTGTADTSGQVRAERSGTGTGRVYTLTYQGADQAGNMALCSGMVSVPHDRGN